MSADRCGQLCAIAIANELYEGWMALFPILPVVYIALYFPNLTRLYEKADCCNKFMTDCIFFAVHSKCWDQNASNALETREIPFLLPLQRKSSNLACKGNIPRIFTQSHNGCL